MRRSGFKIMAKLIGLVSPLIHVMFLAVSFGVLGFLASIFITTISAKLISFIITGYSFTLLKKYLILILLLGILRGFLRYLEQLSNHYIAFKLLAIIRNKVFTVLRKLAPAKLEGKDKGNLISLITSDIELLEVFYAHTISPILIALITSLIMSIYIGKYHIYLGLCAAFSYFIIGVILPLYASKDGKEEGLVLRNDIGNLNTFIYDSLRGMDEIKQYNSSEKTLNKLNFYTEDIINKSQRIKDYEAKNRAITTTLISVLTVLMFSLGIYLYSNNKIDLSGVLVTSVAMISSFGPVLTLSNLSANMRSTLASGERVLSLLEEKPVVNDVTSNERVDFNKLEVSDAKFSYDKDNIIDNLNLNIDKGTILGIYGKSGSGKSTFLKLLMRFWELDSGEIRISNKNINEIDTSNLRDLESYVVQDTYIFEDTIKNNIKVGKKDASMEEIITASKKASIHDFIMSLKDAYDTKLGEKSIKLSSGEKQRIGLARAFLNDADLIMLDEPTSNLDSLNESIVLSSLDKFREGKTMIIVSHRKSALNIADRITEFKSNRKS